MEFAPTKIFLYYTKYTNQVRDKAEAIEMEKEIVIMIDTHTHTPTYSGRIQVVTIPKKTLRENRRTKKPTQKQQNKQAEERTRAFFVHRLKVKSHVAQNKLHR